MMNRKKIFTVLTLLCLLSVSLLHVKAYNTYTVTVLAGLHGQVNGGDKAEFTVTADAAWSPADHVTVTAEEGYYFKGFHLSGIEGTLTGAQKIDSDKVYVATYGIRGELVDYEVRYEDESGKTLLAKQTFVGNPGDKPVVSFRYIEGYQPQAYNLTKTLVKEDSVKENVFTFKYHKAEGSGTSVIYDDTIITYTRPGTGTGTGGGTAPSGNTPGTAPAEPGNTPGGTTPTPTEEPAQIIDIDDPNTPQAGPETADPNATAEPGGHQSGTLPSWILPAGGGVLGIGILALLIAFLRRRKKEE